MIHIVLWKNEQGWNVNQYGSLAEANEWAEFFRKAGKETLVASSETLAEFIKSWAHGPI